MNSFALTKRESRKVSLSVMCSVDSCICAKGTAICILAVVCHSVLHIRMVLTRACKLYCCCMYNSDADTSASATATSLTYLSHIHRTLRQYNHHHLHHHHTYTITATTHVVKLVRH